MTKPLSQHRIMTKRLNLVDSAPVRSSILQKSRTHTCPTNQRYVLQTSRRQVCARLPKTNLLDVYRIITVPSGLLTHDEFELGGDNYPHGHPVISGIPQIRKSQAKMVQIYLSYKSTILS